MMALVYDTQLALIDTIYFLFFYSCTHKVDNATRMSM